MLAGLMWQGAMKLKLSLKLLTEVCLFTVKLLCRMANARLYDLAIDTEPQIINGAVQRSLIYFVSWLKPYVEVAARVNWLATIRQGTYLEMTAKCCSPSFSANSPNLGRHTS